ncbi:Xaa-Pro peptidase family protein (plasmid) [Sinorhizobium medicae]|uniref:M24 family metallopeptidase n=1 Tax=Sinorhizobium medicae TaxID=110321 RepID=UPI002AF6C1A2|nr:Xaa-Pro peptidase family protein [Sinorhizobium medicae]WQO62246.1 Xaa-Pro peptidase family protein [Sinorhizobium medicae]
MTTIDPIPFTGLPFPKSEYQRRQQRVLEAMARAEIDALLVTAPGHQEYLTGYDGTGGYFAPFPFILVPGRAPIYVAREFDVETVRAESCIEEIIPYSQQSDFAPVCADVLRRIGLQSRRLGMELGCSNLAPADLNAVQMLLPGLKVVDASRLVPSVSAVKSHLEIKAIRSAMTTTDLAVTMFHRSLHIGVTETEMLASITDELDKSGGELCPGTTLLFGERTRLPHGAPKKHPIRNNEPAFLEIGTWKHKYAAALCRSGILGRSPEIESLHSLAEEALEAAIAAIRPGQTAGGVDAAARGVIERAGRPQVFRHRTGYQIGINWTERGDLSLEPGASDILEVGMTLHMPMILFHESGHGIGCSETVLVTESGAEVLSSTPHTLYRA